MANIESVSNEDRSFPPSAALAATANVTSAGFDAMNAEAARDFTGFN